MSCSASSSAPRTSSSSPSILIWFGIHQRFTSLFVRLDDFDSLIGQVDPGALALRVTMEAAGAAKGTLLTRSTEDEVVLRPARSPADSVTHVERRRRHWSAIRRFGSSFLFDVRQESRADQDRRSWARFGRAAAVLDPGEAERLGLAQRAGDQASLAGPRRAG